MLPDAQDRVRARAPRFAFLLAALLLGTSPAFAQFNVFAPLFRDLNGGSIWGSVGSGLHSQAAQEDKRPIWRAGFAALYGPFGGGGDTIIVHTFAVIDTTDSTITMPDGSIMHRRTRAAKEQRSESKRLGRGGKVTIAAGYQHSAFYRLPGTPIPPTVAVGGLYFGFFLGPYDAPIMGERLKWYGGLAGTITQLSGLAGRVDTLAVELNTERTVAPEFYLMFTYLVSPNYRVMVSASYQYLRFGSVAYTAVEDGRLIPGGVLARLPEEIWLESVHLTVGVSFAASSLFPAH